MTPTGQPETDRDVRRLTTYVADIEPDAWQVYRTLHRSPELSGREWQTSRTVAGELARLGIDVRTGIGGSGVVGVLRNGPGPVVALRAELDGLAVPERTGLEFASTARARVARGRTVAVSHACAHDLHLASVLGALAVWAGRRTHWSGTVVALFQPAEETGDGAQRMLDDGLRDAMPLPDVLLAQHSSPMPVGSVTLRPGPMTASVESRQVVLHGRGGHAAFPDQADDLLRVAARIVLAMGELTPRPSAGTPRVRSETIHAGLLEAGESDSSFSDTASLSITVRTGDPRHMHALLQRIRERVHEEVRKSGCTEPFEMLPRRSYTPVENDPDAAAAVYRAFAACGVPAYLLAASSLAGDDFGRLGDTLGRPSVYWFWGCSDPAAFAPDDIALLQRGEVPRHIPANHSGRFAPDRTALAAGITNLLVAASPWLAPDRARVPAHSASNQSSH